MENTNEDRNAKFNSGIAKLMRMGKLREGCHDARLHKNYTVWFSCLRGFRSEINSRLSNKEENGFTEKEMAEEYEKKIQEGLDKKEQPKEIDKKLYSYELWLGDIEEKYKFGMPDEDDDEGL